MSQFKAEKQEAGNELTVRLSGHIDEDATFNGLALNGAAKIVLELENVSAINSCGIREWIKWIRTATDNAAIVYKKCPKVIVDQINMVSGFLPNNGKVESFFVPYYSDSSGTEKMILFSEGKEFKGQEVFPPADVKDEGGET